MLRNDSPKQNWLQIRVSGMRIGAKITLCDARGARLGFQEIATDYGYASGQPALAYFGLGKTETVNIEVQFADGKKLVQKNVLANQRRLIEEK